MRAFVIAAALVASAMATTVQAQIITLYSSRPAPVGARATALGEAYASESYDASSFYWNPASLVYLQRKGVVVNHLEQQAISGMNENLAIPFRLGSTDALAIGLTVNHVGYVGNTEGLDFRVIQYGYDLAYAREVIPTFSLGGGIGVRYASTSVSSLWGIGGYVGALYTPSPEVSYGVSYTGIGSGILFVSDRVTTSLRSENLPHTLQAAVTMRFPPEAKQTFLTVAVANEKIFSQDGIRYKGGIEVYPVQAIGLRWGYIYQQNVVGAARYGVGLRTSRFQLDYAIAPSKLAERIYQLSLALTLWN